MEQPINENIGENVGTNAGIKNSFAEPKTKSLRLNKNTPITDLPIKAAQESHFREKISKCKLGKTTAVIGQPFYSGQFGNADKKCHIQTLWRVLLDTGTNGDLYFQKKNKINSLKK